MKAIRKGDWVKAREIFNDEEVTWTSKLDDEGNTAFHFAVGEYKNLEVVRDILMWINSELLVTTVNDDGMNPVHTAALFGNIEALKIMLDSNPKCLFVPNEYWDDLAIKYALKIPSIETFQYLFKKMQSYKDEFDKFLRGTSGHELLGQVIDTGLIDVPIESNSVVSTNTADEENQETPKNDKFVTKYTKDVITRICVKFWETTLLHVPHVKHLKDDKVKHNTTIELLRRICKEVDRTHASNDIIERLYSSPFCFAVENNTDEAIEVLTTYFPQSYWFDKDGQNIFQLTVLNRSEKEMKRVVGTAHTRALNKNKETPMTVFRREHKELRKDGEEWMKKTADSYTITATLIITIVFAAAITVPGGNDDKTGKPIYEMKPSFIIFAIADAISLFTATTSLLDV
nr:hypothetical protein [Tanacetum cinerariifolium]